MSLETTLKEQFANTTGTFGSYILDNKTNQTLVDINSNQTFPNASVAKIFVAGYILDLLRKNEITLDQEFTHTSEDTLQGSGMLKHITTGKQYSVLDLMKLMLLESDNTASKILIRNLDARNINNYLKTFKYIKVSELKVEDNKFVGWGITTPKEAALFLQELLQNQSIVKDIMKEKNSKKSIGYYLLHPNQTHKVNIYSKDGTLYPNVKNDISLIECPDTKQAFINSYFSKDLANTEDSVEIIRLISKDIAQLLNK